MFPLKNAPSYLGKSWNIFINPPKSPEKNGPNRAKAHRQGHLMFHPSDDGRGRQVPAHRAEGPFRELLEVVASAFYGKIQYGKNSERFGCHFSCELMVWLGFWMEGLWKFMEQIGEATYDPRSPLIRLQSTNQLGPKRIAVCLFGQKQDFYSHISAHMKPWPDANHPGPMLKWIDVKCISAYSAL